jgi:hypothetical protein
MAPNFNPYAREIAEYDRLNSARLEIVRKNASRRMKRQSPLPVPPKPTPVMIPYAFEQDGTYAGWLDRPGDLPEGMILKWKAHNKDWQD